MKTLSKNEKKFFEYSYAINILIESIAYEDIAICKEVFYYSSTISTEKPFCNKIYAHYGESFSLDPNLCPYRPPFGPNTALCKAVLPFLS